MGKNKKHLNSDFIPYELSLKLFELGMDDKFEYGEYSIFGHYYKRRSNLNKSDDNLYPLDIGYVEYNQNFEQWEPTSLGIAPLWQQVFDWFREEYGLNVWIQEMENFPDHYTWYIKSTKGIVLNEYSEPRFKSFKMNFETYDDARLSVLNQLIKIIENENNTSI